MDVAQARKLIEERGWFWARCADSSAIAGKYVRVNGIAEDLDPPLLLWSAQPLWFGDQGAGSGIWKADSLEFFDGEPAWRDRHGT